MRTLPSGLAAGREHLMPLATDLLEESKQLTEKERAAAGAYLEAVTAIFARHARGDDIRHHPKS